MKQAHVKMINKVMHLIYLVVDHQSYKISIKINIALKMKYFTQKERYLTIINNIKPYLVIKMKIINKICFLLQKA